jgi:hypothetical protein
MDNLKVLREAIAAVYPERALLSYTTYVIHASLDHASD